MAIAWTGGGRIETGWFRLSAVSWWRPLAAAGFVFVVTEWARRPAPDGAAARLARLAPATLTIATLAVTSTYVVHACGGLDSHGYVAFAELLSRGRLWAAVPSLSWLPVDRLAEVAAPLGFVPSGDGARLVPEFPAGLPILMAAARRVAGAEAVFWVPWLCYVGLVATVFAIARDRYDGLTASIAAAAMAAHPVAVASGIQPMSDVPASFVTAAAVHAATRRAGPWPLAAGFLGSLAILIRPPLLLPVGVLCAWLGWRSPRHGLVMAAGVLPGLLGLLWVQDALFGSPFVSGHGSASALFTVNAAAGNLLAQGKWLVVVHTPLFFAALWPGWLQDRAFAASMMLLAGAVAVPYVFYAVPFDDWEMLRFLLPGICLLMPVAAGGVARVLRSVNGAAVRHAAVAALAALMMVASFRWLGTHGILTLQQAEAKYPRVGAWFAQRTPAAAVVLASLHSGSVHYYSGRQTLRWDVLPPDRLAQTVATAQAQGVAVYTALEGYEVPEFTSRFADALAGAVAMEPLDRVATTFVAVLRPR